MPQPQGTDPVFSSPCFSMCPSKSRGRHPTSEQDCATLLPGESQPDTPDLTLPRECAAAMELRRSRALESNCGPSLPGLCIRMRCDGILTLFGARQILSMTALCPMLENFGAASANGSKGRVHRRIIRRTVCNLVTQKERIKIGSVSIFGVLLEMTAVGAKS